MVKECTGYEAATGMRALPPDGIPAEKRPCHLPGRGASPTSIRRTDPMRQIISWLETDPRCKRAFENAGAEGTAASFTEKTRHA